MIPNEIQFSDDGELPERYRIGGTGEPLGTYRAVCSFCGDWQWFSAAPDHVTWMKQSDYERAKVKLPIIGEWIDGSKKRFFLLADPISDRQARIEADDLNGSRYVSPKPCERCLADSNRRKAGSGRPGMGTSVAPIAENGG